MSEASKKPAAKKAKTKKNPESGTVSSRMLSASGKIIEQARKNAGMTQKGLAKLLKVTAGSIGKIEKGKAMAPLHKANDLMKALKLQGKDAEYLKEVMKSAGGITKKAGDITIKSAGGLSKQVSAGAAQAWGVFSAEEKREMTRNILELGGNLSNAHRTPSEEDMVLFAVHAAGEDERRFRKILDALDIPVGRASQIITQKLQAQLRNRS